MQNNQSFPPITRNMLYKWCLIALAYFLCAKFSLLFIIQPEGISVFWPPSGLFLASLLLTTRREWKYILALLFFTDLANSISSDYALLASVGMAIANCTDAFVGAWVCRRLLGETSYFNSLKGVLGFTTIVVFINAPLSALIGSVSISFGNDFEVFSSTWRVWWTSSALGSLLLVPLLLSIASHNFSAILEQFRAKPGALIELTGLIASVLLVTYLIFSQQITAELKPLLYLVFPLLIWSAVRYGTLGAASVSLAISAIAVWHALQGYGPIELLHGVNEDNLVWLQLYICTFLLSALLLASTIQERDEAQKQYRLVAEAIPSMIAYLDEQGVYRYVNKHYADWFGKGTEQIVGAELKTIVGEPTYQSVRENFKQCLRGNEVTWGGDVEFADNVVKHVHATYVPYFDVQNKIRGVLAVVNDVSEVKTAEQTIRLQSQIVENMAEGVHLTRASDGIIVYVNTRFSDMFGYSGDELVGLHVSILNAPSVNKEPEKTATEIIDSVKRHGYWQGEVYNVKKDRTCFWSLAMVTSFYHVEFGDVLLTVQQNIEQQKKAEQGLRQSEATVRTLLNAPTDQIVLISNTGDILALNDAALYELVKESPQVEVGHCYYKYLTEPLETKMRNAIGQVIRQKAATSFQVEWMERWYESTVYPIFDEDRNVQHLAIFCRDISTLKQQEQKKVLVERKQRDALVREVHHRIKNNLQSVIGLLRRSVINQPEFAPLVEDAVGQVSTIAIVHGLQGSRAFAKLEVVELLETIVDVACELSGTQIIVENHVDPNTLFYLVDSESVPVALILNELITNAVKHGTVVDSDAAPVCVAVRVEQDDLLITVKNSSTALPGSFGLNQDRVAGMGLKLVRSLLPSHGVKLVFNIEGGYVCAHLRLCSPTVMTQIGSAETVE